MQSKIYNSYRITHKNGSVEEINAENLIEALKHMEISEEYSPVLQTYMQAEGIRTLVSDMPEAVPFTCVVNESAGGSIATPVSGNVHEGDSLTFKAIPARNYVFESWELNGKVISTQAEFVLTMPSLEGEASAVFKANFRLADVAWTTAVEPAEAGSAGCIAFPTEGVSEANAEAEFLAVAKDGFVFDHWDVNGESVSTNELLQITVTPLAEGESARVYKAVFRAE